MSVEEEGRTPLVDLYHQRTLATIAIKVGVAREKRAIAQSSEFSEHLPRRDSCEPFQGIKTPAVGNLDRIPQWTKEGYVQRNGIRLLTRGWYMDG